MGEYNTPVLSIKQAATAQVWYCRSTHAISKLAMKCSKNCPLNRCAVNVLKTVNLGTRNLGKFQIFDSYLSQPTQVACHWSQSAWNCCVKLNWNSLNTRVLFQLGTAKLEAASALKSLREAEHELQVIKTRCSEQSDDLVRKSGKFFYQWCDWCQYASLQSHPLHSMTQF